MFRMLFFIIVGVLVCIPHTSIQDVSVPTENQHQRVRRASTVNKAESIQNLILTLTEQQYQYETAYYALTLNNVFPNFAKLFHERSEQKYHDVKGLIRLCQVLNLEINLQPIASRRVSEPLLLLSPNHLNKTNFAQFFSELQKSECVTTSKQLSNVYQQTMNISVPLQMYLKEKLYMKHILTCKRTSDLYTQLDRLIDGNLNDKSIPFSFMFVDSRAKNMLSE